MWGGISFIGRVAAVFGSDSCFALECSPQAEISHQCRRRVADQLSGGETVAGTGRPRTERSRPADPSDEALQHGRKRNHLRALGAELSCSAGDKIRGSE